MEMKSNVINRYYRRLHSQPSCILSTRVCFQFRQFDSIRIRFGIQNWELKLETLSLRYRETHEVDEAFSFWFYCENSLISICLKLLIDFAMNKYYAMIAICSCCCRRRCCCCCCCCSFEGICFYLIFEFGACRRCAFCGPFKPRIICWIILFCYLQQRWRRCCCCCHVYKNILMPVCDFHEINKIRTYALSLVVCPSHFVVVDHFVVVCWRSRLAVVVAA